MLKGKKIVVTGGAGFIGSNIVDKLLSEQAEVVVVDNLKTGKIENISHVLKDISFKEVDICNTEKLKEIFKDAFAVLHQAAIPSVPRSLKAPLDSHEANSSGTLSVLLAAKDASVDRVVLASSSSVYGDSPILPKTEAMLTNPLSPYAVQKLSGELYSKLFFNIFGLKTIALRYFNVFGPRQNPDSEYSAVIPKFIKLIIEGKQPQIYGDGEHTRDFTHVSNVVNANILALGAEEGFGEVYNIAAGNRVSLNSLVEKINKAIGKSIKQEYLPKRKGDIKDSYADINKAKEVLGYKPEVSFDDGLKMTIEYINETIDNNPKG